METLELAKSVPESVFGKLYEREVPVKRRIARDVLSISGIGANRNELV